MKVYHLVYSIFDQERRLWWSWYNWLVNIHCVGNTWRKQKYCLQKKKRRHLLFSFDTVRLDLKAVSGREGFDNKRGWVAFNVSWKTSKVMLKSEKPFIFCLHFRIIFCCSKIIFVSVMLRLSLEIILTVLTCNASRITCHLWVYSIEVVVSVCRSSRDLCYWILLCHSHFYD